MAIGNPDSLRSRAPEPTGSRSLHNRALGVIAFATVLALLYVGRGVLIPLSIALMLSLLITPMVRRLKRIGLSQTSAVIFGVLAFSVVVTTAAGVLGTQLLRLVASLPRYESTIQLKLRNVDEMTVGRLDALIREASRLAESPRSTPESIVTSGSGDLGVPPPIPVELHQPHPAVLQILAKVLASLWGPLESIGIVLLVLVFVLLEHEEFRDRFIRIAGGTDIRAMTLGLNDAGERLSRFFLSQFAVNLGVGVTIGLGLGVLGFPQAAFWGALAALLRFLPYVGIWFAALLATALAIAVVPGWSLAIGTLALFTSVELTTGQIIEPRLYGHSTGLSPLSIVLAAIFWSALWGPIGLVVSTPITVCLLVIGRHLEALSFLDVLLGNAQPLTQPQRFYERALSGDLDQILVTARAFLKRDSFASYCDLVLMPALYLGLLDRETGGITDDQHRKMRDLLVALVSALGGEPRGSRRRLSSSVLDDQDAGLILRLRREALTRGWQGPAAAAPESTLLCLGLGSSADTFATELLVRALQEQGLDARHVAEPLEAGLQPPDRNPAGVAIAYLVSALPDAARERVDPLVDRVRQHFPRARVVSVFLPGISLQPELPPPVVHTDYTVSSFVEAVHLAATTQPT